ncbi:natural killer cell receptor 2B4-like isoform X1 [Puntigrus tetrazona]|uniref:natural killer cell receptor 2B4-like isoform X1 n=1 Tax=Puntigrus tetrazona TaxID=1606681 RepID=UPI001C8A2E34|nr:natural killer cell receptor 2B4-like isoform X1 [Puntigrus tetrazona]
MMASLLLMICIMHLLYEIAPLPVTENSNYCLSSESSVSKCLLLCWVVNVSHVTLSWYKGNSLLSSINVSDLSISLSLPLEVEYQEKNIYSCVINNPIRNQTTHLNISEVCQTCSDWSALQISKVVVFASAAVNFLIVAVTVMVCIYRKHKKKEQKVQTSEEEITYADPTFCQQKMHKARVQKEEDVVYAGVSASR